MILNIGIAFNNYVVQFLFVIGEGILNSLSFLLTSHRIVLHFVYFEAEHALCTILIANRYS